MKKKHLLIIAALLFFFGCQQFVEEIKMSDPSQEINEDDAGTRAPKPLEEEGTLIGPTESDLNVGETYKFIYKGLKPARYDGFSTSLKICQGNTTVASTSSGQGVLEVSIDHIFTNPGEYRVYGELFFYYMTGGLNPDFFEGRRYRTKTYYVQPKITISGPEDVIRGETAAYTVHSDTGSITPSVNWQCESATPSSGQGKDVSLVFNEVGTQTLEFILNYGTTQYSVTKNINVKPEFEDIMISGPDLVITDKEEPYQVEYSVEYSDMRTTPGDVEIQWKVNGIIFGSENGNPARMKLNVNNYKNSDLVEVTINGEYSTTKRVNHVRKSGPLISGPKTIPNSSIQTYHSDYGTEWEVLYAEEIISQSAKTITIKARQWGGLIILRSRARVGDEWTGWWTYNINVTGPSEPFVPGISILPVIEYPLNQPVGSVLTLTAVNEFADILEYEWQEFPRLGNCSIISASGKQCTIRTTRGVSMPGQTTQRCIIQCRIKIGDIYSEWTNLLVDVLL